MAHDAFISHSSKDKSIADAICANLEAAGIRCWIAPRDIAAGEDWPRAIANAISQSRIMVLIFSANANSSDQISRELSVAADYNLVIIPFKIENVKPEPGKQYYLSRTHWLDAMNPPTQEQINLLVERVKSIIPEAGTGSLEKTPLPIVKSVAFPRRAVITVGSIALGLGVLAVFFIPLSAFPAQLFATSTPGNTPTPIFTTTPMLTFTPAVSPTPTLGIGSTLISDGVTMMYVPAGTFSMGGYNSDAQPFHTVYLDGYYMDKYEVTNAAYKRCVDAGKCLPPEWGKSRTRSAYYGNPKFDEYPLMYVDWYMAKTYCEWRASRLPTEAEWENAARGTDDRAGANGDDTAQVGSYESDKSLYGIYDMAGNVNEWVSDWYGESYYQSSPSSNPLGPSSGKYRVLRLGPTVRHRQNPGDSYYVAPGFRCARGTSP